MVIFYSANPDDFENPHWVGEINPADGLNEGLFAQAGTEPTSTEALSPHEIYLDELTGGIMAVVRDSYRPDGELILLNDEFRKIDHTKLVDHIIRGRKPETSETKARAKGLEVVREQTEGLKLIADRDEYELRSALDYWSLGRLQQEFGTDGSDLTGAVREFFLAAGRKLYQKEKKADPSEYKLSDNETLDLVGALDRLITDSSRDESLKLLVTAAHKNAVRRRRYWGQQLTAITNSQNKMTANSSGAPKRGKKGSVLDPVVQRNIDHVDRVMR